MDFPVRASTMLETDVIRKSVVELSELEEEK